MMKNNSAAKRMSTARRMPVVKQIVVAVMALLMCVLIPMNAELCSAAEAASETVEDAEISTLEEDADTDTGISVEDIEDVTASASDGSDADADAAADAASGESAISSGICGSSDNTAALTWNLSDGVLTISGSGAMADYDASESTYARGLATARRSLRL
ncbi:MAG: hypothetical protein LUI14_10545 [Lachnospiraceae bacterium]|nr:hypothetical protein [Lachnospiraceae bacterium]